MISYLVTLSLEYSITCSFKSNLMVTFHQLRSGFPFLFSKFLHIVCIEVQAPIDLFSNVLLNFSIDGERFWNLSQNTINMSLKLDILYNILLDASLSSQLLVKYNVIHLLLFLQDEFFVSKFLHFLKSDRISSIAIICQLKLAYLTNQNAIFIKQCVSLLEYIHVSVIPEYISTLTDLFSISRYFVA